MNPSSEREALLELLRHARPYVEHGAKRFYDGVGGYVQRDRAKHLLDQIDRAALSTQPQQAGVKDSLTAQHEQAGWMPIEAMPLDEIESAPGHFDKWAKDWLLLGRQDEHGWVSWVGTLEAGMWLERDSSRACGDSEKPSHWMPLPLPPVHEGGGHV